MAEVKYDKTHVKQQLWAFLRNVIKLPEESAAGVIGSWICENGQIVGCPDPTNIEGIITEPLYIGSRKKAAMANWQSYAYTLSTGLNEAYRGEDGKFYPGIGLWSCTGKIVTQLFKAAKRANTDWWDLDVQLQLYKKTYFDSGFRGNLIKILKRGGDVVNMTDAAYGMIAYGYPYAQDSARYWAKQIYAEFKGKNFTYTGKSSGQSGPNKLEEFIQKCLSYKGISEGTWASKHPKWYWPSQWCAGFVSGCAEEVGILGKVFDGSLSAYVCAHSVKKYGGQVHNEKSYTPQRGDLINYNWSGRTAEQSDAISFCDHIGVVLKCENGVVYAVGGNESSSVLESNRARSNPCFCIFCTPDWAKVGGMASSDGSGGFDGKLFDETNTREDAIVREIAFLDTEYDKNNAKKVKKYKAELKSTDIDLSIANYTELMNTYWETGKSSADSGDGGSNDGEYDYSKLDPKVREVVKYLVGKGLNNAAACGIAGNIKHESNFNTASVGDGGTSFGICQWHNERGAKMKQVAGSNWANNLTGQLDYLWQELESSYKTSTLDKLKAVENNESGCKQAADIFVRNFEIPANVDYQSQIRQETAISYYKQIKKVQTSKSSSFSSVNLKNVSKAKQDRVKRAQSCLGKPYGWGAVGPSSYDCSGLVSYCVLGRHERLGTTDTFLTYPRTNNPEPGDICTNSGHCGLYIGDNKMIHAADYGIGVIEGPVQSGMVYVTYG